MEDLHPIRLFYRRHLSEYAWARRLKPVVVNLWFAYLQIRHIIVWRFHYRLHLIDCVMNQRVQAFSLAMERRKCRSAGAGNYLTSRMFGSLELLSLRALSRKRSFTTMNLTFFSMVTFNEYCKTYKPVVSQLSKAETFLLAIPTVYPEEYRQNLYSEIWPLDVPSVQAIEISNAEIMGKCDFIFSGVQCLHHGLYRFEQDLPMEEMHGMVCIDTKQNLLVRYKESHEQMEALPAAISMIGSASANYVHWLTETAPKLALIDEIENYADLPLVIDAELHPNILESLHCLNSRKRKLIPIKRGQICRIDKLVAVTPVAYVPFEFRRGTKRDVPEIHPGLAMYVPKGLNLLRQKLVSHFADEEAGRSTRLYLRRTAKSRQMSNAAEVEALLQEQGFQIVEPETLTFAEQVRLFSNAEVIVGQGGAAFGNIIFAPKECHVVILTTWSPFTIYYYFSNLASVLGQRCSFVLCDPVEEIDSFHLAHKGLNVNIHNLKKVIGP